MFSIVHRVFLEYLQHCDVKQRGEMIDLLGEHLVHMLHTKDGAQVAMHCIWYGAAKVKPILYIFQTNLKWKPHISQLWCINRIVKKSSNHSKASLWRSLSKNMVIWFFSPFSTRSTTPNLSPKLCSRLIFLQSKLLTFVSNYVLNSPSQIGVVSPDQGSLW